MSSNAIQWMDIETLHNMNSLKIPAIILFLTIAANSAFANDAERRGKAIVDQWCRSCHQQITDKPDPDMAPPYETIVRWPGRNKAYFTRFLKEDHFPMTIYRLFDHEKRDVIAYLMSLQK